MINYRWGQRLRALLHNPEIFSLLNRLNEFDAEFTSWNAGGCRVLACALHAALAVRTPADRLSLKIIASDQCPAEHVVLRVETGVEGVWYLDGDGATRERTLLARFAAREYRTGCRLVDYDEGLLDRNDIHCPPLKLARLITKLNKALPSQ